MPAQGGARSACDDSEARWARLHGMCGRRTDRPRRDGPAHDVYDRARGGGTRSSMQRDSSWLLAACVVRVVRRTSSTAVVGPVTGSTGSSAHRAREVVGHTRRGWWRPGAPTVSRDRCAAPFAIRAISDVTRHRTETPERGGGAATDTATRSERRGISPDAGGRPGPLTCADRTLANHSEPTGGDWGSRGRRFRSCQPDSGEPQLRGRVRTDRARPLSASSGGSTTIVTAMSRPRVHP